MFDLREHKDLIRRLVSEANQNDPNWKWSVNSIGKEKARIFWEYLEYCGEPEPFFIIELEVTGEGCWIHGTVETFSPSMQKLFLLNPIYCYIKYFRVVVLDGNIPSMLFHFLCAAYALVTVIIGGWIYKKYNHKFLYYV